jgi:hypothetical protein
MGAKVNTTEPPSMARLTRMAEGMHDPQIAQDASRLRERLGEISGEAQALIALDPRSAASAS